MSWFSKLYVKPAVAESRTSDLARAFDLTDALSRPVSDYSAGMRKKAQVVDKLEKLSVADARRAIDFAEVVVLLLDATRAVISVWGADKVAVRLGPSGSWGDMSDSNPEALFTYVADELDKLGIAYLHLIEPRIAGNVEDEARDQQPVAARSLRTHFHGPIIAAGGFDGESAEAILQSGDADLVAFGRHFIANPDLPERLRKGLPLNPYDRATFFGGTDVGYTDYPFHDEAAVAA